MESEYEPPSERCHRIAERGGLPWLAVWGLTVLTAVLGVAFAFAQHGPFDWSLLIQTAMIIVLIWYTYFTFRMARPRAWVQLRINPSIHPNIDKATLRPEVENKTERLLHARMIVRVWVVGNDRDNEPISLGPFYQGKRYFPIAGRLNPAGYLPLGRHLEQSADGFSEDALIVDFKAQWIDDSLCESGETRKSWRVDLHSGITDALIDPERRGRLFAKLEDPYEDNGPAEPNPPVA